MTEPYLQAALNKISIVERFFSALEKLREGEDQERPEIQLNFEGVLASGFSAGDQLARAIATRLGIKGTDSAGNLLKALESGEVDLAELADCTNGFLAWVREPIVRDARRRRNQAVHSHYEKTPHKLARTWILQPITLSGGPSPYKGPLDVHSYCAMYVAALRRLRDVARCLETKAS